MYVINFAVFYLFKIARKENKGWDIVLIEVQVYFTDVSYWYIILVNFVDTIAPEETRIGKNHEFTKIMCYFVYPLKSEFGAWVRRAQRHASWSGYLARPTTG